MAPLFNGEGLRGPVEDLTETTRCLLQHGMSAEVMVGKLEGFLKMAMESIKIKLSTGPDDNKLANRLVELWSFYFGTVLPYLQGVFLPLESELKSNRSATCVRSTILLVYKNEMILPILGRIQGEKYYLRRTVYTIDKSHSRGISKGYYRSRRVQTVT